MADTVFGINKLSVNTQGDKILMNASGSTIYLNQGVSGSDAFAGTGFTLTNKTNRLDANATLEQSAFVTSLTGNNFVFNINGERFEFAKDTTIATIMNTINNSNAGVNINYSSITDKFTMTSKSTGASSGIAISDETGNFLSSIMGTLDSSNYTKGTDASVYIDGEKVTRSSNTFMIDGITYALKENSSDTFKMNITADTNAAFNNIKTFISDYNDIIDMINSKISEERYKDFLPLTDEQKSSLSETEATKWQDKAKSGLLKNDSYLQQIASSLREAMYSTVADLNDNSKTIGLTMSGIGISTSDFTSKGKLTVDEQKLKDALANNLDGVMKLFTQRSDKFYSPDNTDAIRQERTKESGILYKISDILDDSARTTLGGGTLLKIAGYKGTSTDTENIISKSIDSYSKKLDSLLESLTKEENRYFTQFAAMEKYISQMNQQSAWLSQNLGS
jgi:flagellar hook-associated protein 2